ncbi:MAG: N-acetylmannosamine-6-phosphate 2-epimerase [Psychromonas sp.]|nr:N-acetylmannosamine-6-phosphate 2-epimerase [Psychromonas sp.]
MKSGLIVSCQALEGEALHSSFIMSKMALAAMRAGAVGIRANGISDIEAIKKEVNLPIIGIIKKDYDHLKSYITATKKELEALIELNVDVIALDATIDADIELLSSLKKEYPNQKFMADISIAEEGIQAEKYGFDYIGTTLVGYTEHSKKLDKFDVLREIIAKTNTPVIAEGNFSTPEEARKALDIGAYAVVVGGAITRPEQIAKKFVDAIKK